MKDFGEAGSGILSFPCPGYTLAIDFAIAERTPALVAGLDREVLASGGRIYLAKEAFTSSSAFAAMEGERLESFLRIKRQWDPADRIRSRQWDRLVSGAGDAQSGQSVASDCHLSCAVNWRRIMRRTQRSGSRSMVFSLRTIARR